MINRPRIDYKDFTETIESLQKKVDEYIRNMIHKVIQCYLMENDIDFKIWFGDSPAEIFKVDNELMAGITDASGITDTHIYLKGEVTKSVRGEEEYRIVFHIPYANIESHVLLFKSDELNSDDDFMKKLKEMKQIQKFIYESRKGSIV